MLGGNSIAAAQVTAAVREQYSVELELRDFFDARTLEAFAAHVSSLAAAGGRDGRGKATLPPILPASRSGRLPLSHAQERLWFLWNLDPASTAYTVASSIRLKGRLDHPHWRPPSRSSCAGTRSLRTTFSADDGPAGR